MEEYLIESGLDYTIIQPTHFMDLFPVPILLRQPEPVYNALWNPGTKFSYIALRDLGEAAYRVIIERERHYGAMYPLASTAGAVGYDEVCKIAGRKMGKDIHIKQLGFEEAMKVLLDRALGGKEVDAYAKEGIERMLLYYSTRGPHGNKGALEGLIERPATSWEDFIDIRIEEAKEGW